MTDEQPKPMFTVRALGALRPRAVYFSQEQAIACAEDYHRQYGGAWAVNEEDGETFMHHVCVIGRD